MLVWPVALPQLELKIDFCCCEEVEASVEGTICVVHQWMGVLSGDTSKFRRRWGGRMWRGSTGIEVHAMCIVERR